jgi:hypothetical protein
MHDLLANDWVRLAIRTLAITFIGRLILDIATSWVISEDRSGVVASVLAGWSAAVILAADIYGGGLGVLAGIVACLWHITLVLRERAMNNESQFYARGFRG